MARTSSTSSHTSPVSLLKHCGAVGWPRPKLANKQHATASKIVGSTRCAATWRLSLHQLAMARIEGVDPQKTSFLMRQVFKKGRKLLGRDLTPQKIQARVPCVFWVGVLTEWLLGQKAAVPQRLRSIIMLRTAVRVGCPF